MLLGGPSDGSPPPAEPSYPAGPGRWPASSLRSVASAAVFPKLSISLAVKAFFQGLCGNWCHASPYSAGSCFSRQVPFLGLVSFLAGVLLPLLAAVFLAAGFFGCRPLSGGRLLLRCGRSGLLSAAGSADDCAASAVGCGAGSSDAGSAASAGAVSSAADSSAGADSSVRTGSSAGGQGWPVTVAVNLQVLPRAPGPAEIAGHSPRPQPGEGVGIVLVEIHRLPDHIQHITAGVIGKGKSVAGVPPGLVRAGRCPSVRRSPGRWARCRTAWRSSGSSPQGSLLEGIRNRSAPA